MEDKLIVQRSQLVHLVIFLEVKRLNVLDSTSEQALSTVLLGDLHIFSQSYDRSSQDRQWPGSDEPGRFEAMFSALCSEVPQQDIGHLHI